MLPRDGRRRTPGDGGERESGLGPRRARLRGGEGLRRFLDRGGDLDRDLDLDRDQERDRDTDRGRRRFTGGRLGGDPGREECIEEASLPRRLRTGSGENERAPLRRGGDRLLPPLPWGDRERDLER